MLYITRSLAEKHYVKLAEAIELGLVAVASPLETEKYFVATKETAERLRRIPEVIEFVTAKAVEDGSIVLESEFHTVQFMHDEYTHELIALCTCKANDYRLLCVHVAVAYELWKAEKSA